VKNNCANCTSGFATHIRQKPDLADPASTWLAEYLLGYLLAETTADLRGFRHAGLDPEYSETDDQAALHAVG
jgi:hypothetical protein